MTFKIRDLPLCDKLSVLHLGEKLRANLKFSKLILIFETYDVTGKRRIAVQVMGSNPVRV